MSAPSTCRTVLSAYDHWSCQRRRFHLGRHRFNNYTGARFPRLWRLDQWVRTLRGNRRLRGYGKHGSRPSLISHRGYLFPVLYDPCPEHVACGCTSARWPRRFSRPEVLKKVGTGA